MRVTIVRTLTACSLLLAASPVFAHHFFPRESDTPVAITGTVVRFEMRNPHSIVVVDVKDRAGNSNLWTIEMGSVANLVARGWERTALKPGDPFTAEVILGKGRANWGAAREVVLPDGRRVFAGSHAGDKPRSY